jgi:hypothetical protein
MKHLRETFTEQEWIELKASKDSLGLNWHDYILKKVDYVGVVSSGMFKLDAVCLKCGAKQVVANLGKIQDAKR